MALRRPLGLLLVALATFGAPSAALAVVHVPAGQRVGELTVVADNVRVDGAVTGSVTILDGSLTVGPSGRLDDRAVVIGGHTTILPGGQIRGDVFQLGSRWPLPEGPVAVLLIAVLVAIRAIVVWLVISLAEILARQGRIAAVANEARRYPLRTVLVGLVAGLGLGAVSILLAITVLGLVAAAALWGLLLAAAVVGVAVLLRELGDEARATRLLGVTLFLPVVGEIVASLATIVALGAATRTVARPHALTPPAASRG